MLWGNLDIQEVNLKNSKEIDTVRCFLETFGLTFDGDVEFTLAAFRNGKIIATGSFAGEVLRNIAVLDEVQGEGITAEIASILIREQGHRGRFHYFIYTRPEKSQLFSGLGFQEIARFEPYAALLESGMGSILSYCDNLRRQSSYLPEGLRAAIVVNCNPFTLGHREVIKTAAAACESLIVFVVSEDRSLFPLEHRIELVRQGTADLKNVAVVEGGKYIISGATFPAYFTRGEDAVKAQTGLDVTIFGRHIAPALGIMVRYAGEEPYCDVTRAYNQAMMDILPTFRVDVKIIQRLSVDGEAISASNVRELIRRNDFEKIRHLVPETTFNYLKSAKAEPILAKIRESVSRH